MAANTQPIFIGSVFTGIATLDSQVIPRGGTGILPAAESLLVTAGSYGALIHSITAIPVADSGTIAACTLRIFRLASGSSDLILCLPEVELPAIADTSSTVALPSKTVPLPDIIVGDIGTQGLLLGAGDSLYAGLSVALPNGGYNVVVQGGQY